MLVVAAYAILRVPAGVDTDMFVVVRVPDGFIRLLTAGGGVAAAVGCLTASVT